MKKRILSLLLVLGLLATPLPAGALAAEAPGGLTADCEALMDAIAQRLTTLPDGWVAMDLALYSTLPGKSAQLTSDAQQSALDAMIAEADSARATAGDLARLELTLRAMGVDSTQLYPAGSPASIDNASNLANKDLTAGGHYPAPWLLLAEQQGNLTLTSDQRQSLLDLLRDNMGDGLFCYTWGDMSRPDPDLAGTVLTALAPYYDTDPQVRSMADAILSALSGAIGDNGSYGSANSDAMVIIGLVSMGRDPGAWKAPSGASVVDGLLSYVNADKTGFTYDGADNLLATEQGFRALTALFKFRGEPLDIYDFSATPVTPGFSSASPLAPTQSSTQEAEGNSFDPSGVILGQAMLATVLFRLLFRVGATR